MKKLTWSKMKIPIIALTVGLIVGLGVGHILIKKEQKVFQDKIREANKKVAFIQKKAAEERSEAAASREGKSAEELDKLRNEKKALEGSLGALKGKVLKDRESDESLSRARKALNDALAVSAGARKELQEMEHKNKDLGFELKKTTGEKHALLTELNKTTQDLDHSESNNARLCVIADELLRKYRNKGLGAVFIEKEPLTQIKKVELEQFTQKYQERIQQQKIKKDPEATTLPGKVSSN